MSFVEQLCKELAQVVHRLPIIVLNAVFQFDGHKITVYYSSNARVDFREFVRDLFSIYKARIWMQKVLFPEQGVCGPSFARALQTGQYFRPEDLSSLPLPQPVPLPVPLSAPVAVPSLRGPEGLGHLGGFRNFLK